MASTTSRSLLLFWEYARHFLCALSQFSNKREAGGMHWADWACFLSGVPRLPYESWNNGDTVSLWKTDWNSWEDIFAAQVTMQQKCRLKNSSHANYLLILISLVSVVLLEVHLFPKKSNLEYCKAVLPDCLPKNCLALMEEQHVWINLGPRVSLFRHDLDLRLKNLKPLTQRDCCCTLTCGNIVLDICIPSAHPFWCSSRFIEEQSAGRLPAYHMAMI